MRSGQALVMVMMVLSVALTVGLSIATRSTNEVKISSSQEESARALEAAEAGLEKALGGTLQGTQVNLGSSNATYVVAPTPTPGAKLDEYIIPFQLVEGQAATVDLSNYTNGNYSEKYKFRFCWGTNTAVGTPGPAIEIDFYYMVGGNMKVGKVIFDPASRIPSSDPGPFNPANCPPGFKYSKKQDLSIFTAITNLDLIQMKSMRLKLLFNGINPEPIAIVVQGSGDFGRQGYEYTSVGSAGTSTQKIRGVELNYDVPAVFDNAIFSGTSLNK